MRQYKYVNEYANIGLFVLQVGFRLGKIHILINTQIHKFPIREKAFDDGAFRERGQAVRHHRVQRVSSGRF